jgi:diacylglycerol O-acyltransferase
MAELKESHEAEAGAALVALGGVEPFPLTALPVRLAARLAQRSVVSVATNVPGPRETLYALGRKLREIVPYVPIGSSMRTGVAIFTYGDRVTFGVTGDYSSAPDVEVLAAGVADGLAELVACTGGREPTDHEATVTARKPA